MNDFIIKIVGRSIQIRLRVVRVSTISCLVCYVVLPFKSHVQN